jgi:Na+/H+-dicarboxylate symporter
MKLGKLSITYKILGALVLGILFGIIFNLFGPKPFNDALIKWVLDPLGNIFLRAIKMVVVPLVLFSLIVGTASIGDVKKLGRIGVKTLGFYLTTTALAVTIALVIANILKPGVGVDVTSTAQAVEAAKPPFILDIFTNMIPTNPIESLVKGDMLQIIAFAIIFGIALTLIGERAKPVIELCDQINNAFLKIITLVMLFAPIGVFALMSKVIITLGIPVILSLFKYVLIVLFGLFLHTTLVYSTALRVLGKVKPAIFFKKFWHVMVFALTTSSSNATIPVNLEACNKKLGASEKVSSFTIPLGATVNMDGTAIMQGVAAMFIAQFFGVDLDLQKQLMIILTATLASIGTAGVPGAGIVMLTMVLQQVGLPLEGVALVLSVDRIVDMFRTVVNITGDAICTLIVAKSEGELDLNVYNNIGDLEVAVDKTIAK